MVTQTQKIYNHLCDDLSTKIFENRLLYSLTGNYEFIKNIISLSFGESALKEYTNSLGAAFEKYKDNDIIIYGAGYLGEHFAALRNKIKIAAFCDSDTKKQGRIFGGYKVISPEQLKQKYSNAIIIIAVLSEKHIGEITETLLNLGIERDLILPFLYKYKASIAEIHHLIKPQYFDPNIILSRVSKNEIFIDGGCCDCYTDIQFAKFYNNQYKRIIAFEPNPEQYPICVVNSKSIANITIHPYGLWNENTELTFDNSGTAGGAHISNEGKENVIKIQAIKLDDILNGQEATFIKLDVEGAELNALKGAERTILKYRPKLAVCLYHKLEDIWEIPAYILSLHDDYKLYIRHYSFGSDATILYAV